MPINATARYMRKKSKYRQAYKIREKICTILEFSVTIYLGSITIGGG